MRHIDFYHVRHRSQMHPVALVLLCACLIAALWAPPVQAEPSVDPYTNAAHTDLADGSYLVELTLSGGTGRAWVTSPAAMTVQNGRAVARIEWSSPHYDYMVVCDELYHPVNQDRNSVFEIPVVAFDEPFTVIGDTTAMSQPHEIEYELTFATSSITPQKDSTSHRWVPVAALAAAAIVAALLLARRRQPHAA